MSKHEEKTNCKNCGAPLHYDETSYGSTAIFIFIFYNLFTGQINTLDIVSTFIMGLLIGIGMGLVLRGEE